MWHENRSAGSNSAMAGAPAPWAGTCSHQTRKRGIAMGLLIKGKWVDQWYDTESSKGEFIRSQSQFRNWVTTDGRANRGGWLPGRARTLSSVRIAGLPLGPSYPDLPGTQGPGEDDLGVGGQPADGRARLDLQTR